MSKRKDSTRLNRAIRVPKVRLVDQNGGQVGIVDVEHALALAEEAGLDLVEVAPNASPPVCRIMNYGKFKFQQRKKQQDARKKQKTIQVKEVKFRPRIDEHDYKFKVKHITKFIAHGDKVRAFVHFRGREMAHRELGLKILERIIEELGDTITVERAPKMEGNQMSIILNNAQVSTKGKA